MSEQVVETGKLVLVSDNLKVFLKHHFGEDTYWEKIDAHGTDEEVFGWEDLYENFVIINDKVYKIEDYINHDDYDVFHASELPDGRIEFVVSYYNGGCSMNEAVEYAVQKMEENK